MFDIRQIRNNNNTHVIFYQPSSIIKILHYYTAQCTRHTQIVYYVYDFWTFKLFKCTFFSSVNHRLYYYSDYKIGCIL